MAWPYNRKTLLQKQKTVRNPDVKIGETYYVRVGTNPTVVRITGESPYGGWVGVNLATGWKIYIRTADRLLGVV